MSSKKTTASAAPQKAGKPKPQDPPAALADDESDSLHTLPALAARFGDATEDEVLVYVGGIGKPNLIERGRKVATSRIDKDTARMYGKAADFAEHPTEEELEAMPAFSTTLLRVAIWAAYQGSRKAESRQTATAKAGSDKQVRVTDAETFRSQGLLQRTQIAAALRTLSGGDQKLLSKINGAAYAGVATAKELSDALGVLLAVGRAMREDDSEPMKTRVKASRLTDARLDALELLAANIRKAGDAAAAPIPVAAVPQAEVDYWDGINLYLLELLIEMFEAGHEAVPTIPRLVPISLRGILGWRSPKAPAGKGGPGTPT